MAGITPASSQETPSEPRWQHLLDRYCDCNQRYQRLLQRRALGYGLLIFSLAMLLFLPGSTPHFHGYWLLASLSGIVTGIPLALHCRYELRKVISQHRELSRELFAAGLRVDEEGQLLTNTAHPRVIAKASRVVVSQ